MTPAQLQALREGLPEFSRAGQPTSEQLEYWRFYGAASLAGWDPAGYRVGTVSSGSYSLAVHRWLLTGAKGTLLLVHGYYDHSGLFGKLVEYALARNFNVLIFDLPGHGLSSGEPAVIDDFREYGQAVADVIAAAHLPDVPLWVMAQSTGCAALVEFARHHAWPFAAAVMLAPLVRPMGWRRGRLAHTLVRGFADSVERKFTDNSSDREFLAFLQRDPLQSRRLPLRWVTALRSWLATLPAADLGVGPALLVQGDADKTVDWRYNLVFFCALFPGSQVYLLPGAGHQLANESVALREFYLDKVDHYLQNLGMLPAPGQATVPPCDTDSTVPG